MRPARNWARPGLLLVAVLICWAASAAAGAVASAAAAGLYGWSLWRHPWRPCWNCRGSGARYGRVWAGTLGRCRACEGDKTMLRWGVRVLAPGYARALRQGKPTRYG